MNNLKTNNYFNLVYILVFLIIPGYVFSQNLILNSDFRSSVKVGVNTWFNSKPDLSIGSQTKNIYGSINALDILYFFENYNSAFNFINNNSSLLFSNLLQNGFFTSILINDTTNNFFLFEYNVSHFKNKLTKKEFKKYKKINQYSEVFFYLHDECELKISKDIFLLKRIISDVNHKEIQGLDTIILNNFKDYKYLTCSIKNLNQRNYYFFTRINPFKLYPLNGNKMDLKFVFSDNYENHYIIDSFYKIDEFLFEPNSYALDSKAIYKIEELLLLLRKYDNLVIEFYGYTDNVGTQESNLKLAKNRIDSITKYMEDKGVPDTRFIKYPIGIDNNENNKNKRRVEIRFIQCI